MHFPKLDAYFYMASQGDSEAFNFLYKDFSSKALNLIRTIINFSANYAGNPADFEYLIDGFFCTVLNNFDPSKGSFSSCADYVLKVRLASQVKEILANTAANFANLDACFEDAASIDLIADPNQIPICEDVAINNFKYKIASPRKDKTNVQRLRDRIILLQYAGFSNIEICKHLNITYSQLRTHLRHIHEEQEIVNLKLDLK